MRIVVSAQEGSLDAPISAVFGRCPAFVIIDTATMQFEAVPNPAISQGGGAGVQSAQWVVNSGARAVLTGNLGPNAFAVLQAAGVPGYLVSEGTVRQAVEAFQSGRLPAMGQASAADHAGLNQRPASAAQTSGREAQLAALRERLRSLRQELAETLTQIEQLEKER